MQGDGNANIDLEKDKNETRTSSKHAKVSLYQYSWDTCTIIYVIEMMILFRLTRRTMIR
jgi:hypothetical protein